MFGDLILRLPDITHAVYKKSKEWEFLIGWAVWTAMESKVFQGADAKMLNLVSICDSYSGKKGLNASCMIP